ncbi:MAG TPA: hypothetical protein VGK73_28820 [Polyangiaceae bacterium]
MRNQTSLVILSLALLAGCSTTSTIIRVSEADVEGDIVGGSPQSIFVATDAGDEYEIPREDIAEIDYPGNVHTGVGIGVLTYGVLNIAVGVPQCTDRNGSDQAAFCAGVFLPAAIGLGLMAWGLVVNGEEKSGVADKSRVSMLEQRPGPRGRFPSWTHGSRRAPAAAPAPTVPGGTSPGSAAPASAAPAAPPPPPPPASATPPAPAAPPSSDQESEDGPRATPPSNSFPVE